MRRARAQIDATEAKTFSGKCVPSARREQGFLVKHGEEVCWVVMTELCGRTKTSSGYGHIWEPCKPQWSKTVFPKTLHHVTTIGLGGKQNEASRPQSNEREKVQHEPFDNTQMSRLVSRVRRIQANACSGGAGWMTATSVTRFQETHRIEKNLQTRTVNLHGIVSSEVRALLNQAKSRQPEFQGAVRLNIGHGSVFVPKRTHTH